MVVILIEVGAYLTGACKIVSILLVMWKYRSMAYISFSTYYYSQALIVANENKN